MSNSMGLDYFNIDVNIFSDGKILKLMNRYGPVGFKSYMIILSEIYSNGYYLEYSIEDATQLLLSRIGGKYFSGKNKIQEMILYLAHIDLIDRELLDQNVITSRGIQKRFLKMTTKRQNQDLDKYWIIKGRPEGIKIKAKEVNEETVQEDKLSKKEIRRRKRIDDIYEGAPRKHYLTSCIIENGYIDNYDLDIPRYNSLFEELSKGYDHDLLFKSVRYLCEHAKRTKINILSKYKFFEVSLDKNLNNEKPFITETFEEMIEKLANID